MKGLLKAKKIILNITGSIAAYKAAILTRLLIKQGAEVQVLMTPTATSFISPLTLSTLSKKPVYTSVVDSQAWNNHVELGLWADAMLIAPATATTMAKCAHGVADSIIVATYLSAKCPVFFAPAMDLDMWKHGSTIQNIKTLESYGNRVIPVGHGELASGLVGDGRMAEPEDIIRYLKSYFSSTQDFIGKSVVVNAGPTYEPIDPVRFIGNHSTGKMGIQIAEEFARRGAKVTLVLGPTDLKPDHSGIILERVTTAEEMYVATVNAYKTADIGILAAAVSDYTPATFSTSKIKKKEGNLHIDLKRTRDIAKFLGASKSVKQLLVGFALETNDENQHARQKLVSKNFDFIVLNSLRNKGAGFGHDTNQVTFLFSDNKEQEFQLKSKKAVAADIADAVLSLLKATTQ
jgi:phosphopantothenoylcysteine decarboxylase/phosphopantothenate--cysteine ligase